jgi:site-specific recombinase XerD
MDSGAPNPLLRSFERHLRAENRSDQTVATYLIALRQAETFLTGSRGTTLAAAGRADLEAYLGDLEAYLGDLLTRRAAATAATYCKVLKLLYQWLEDEDELLASPMAKMRPPIIPDQPVPVIPDDGLRRLLAACAGRALRPAGTPP